MPAYARLYGLFKGFAQRSSARIDVLTRGQGLLSKVETLVEICRELLSERGEAGGTVIAGDVIEQLAALNGAELQEFFGALAHQFGPEPGRVTSSYEAWMLDQSSRTRLALMEAIEGSRQRLFRRMNMAPDGTRALVELRRNLIVASEADSTLRQVENDLQHLLASWFNRGFLIFQQVSWQTPADILEKLIAYEAVHRVVGWDDLRRRLGADRRCYAFFHPALPREPLIFVEVALQNGVTTDMASILTAPVISAKSADTAIFYSISNCQAGLKGINFGNFLIKKVVDELRREFPLLRCFSTLSPIPTFRKWLTGIDVETLQAALGDRIGILYNCSGSSDGILAREFLIEAADDDDPDPSIEELLKQACAYFLCKLADGPVDPVARFHLGNGARLERINPRADSSPNGRVQSFGLMANYLYEPKAVFENALSFGSRGEVMRSSEIDALLAHVHTQRRMFKSAAYDRTSEGKGLSVPDEAE